LLVQAANVGVHFCGFFIDFHCLDSTVVFSGKGIKDKIRVLVESNQVAGLEGGGVDEANDGEEDGLTGRGLDDGGFSLSEIVEIHVGA
jgi:hypothetical protein